MSVNKVILVGRLGQDPDVRYMPNETAVCNFSLATSSSYKDKTGEKVDQTEWHRIVMFGKVAEIAKEYLKKGKLKVSILDRGTAWLDTGTFPSLMQAGQFVQVIEERQNLKIGCIEEVAYRMGYINKAQLHAIAQPLAKSGYGEYLLKL